MPQFVDWPIEYKDLISCYGKAEEETRRFRGRGRADLLRYRISVGHTYPMPKIPNSTTDQSVNKSLTNSMTEDETRISGNGKAVSIISVSGACQRRAIPSPTGIAAPAPATPIAFRSVLSRRNTTLPLR